jgi:hypothetical protein
MKISLFLSFLFVESTNTAIAAKFFFYICKAALLRSQTVIYTQQLHYYLLPESRLWLDGLGLNLWRFLFKNFVDRTRDYKRFSEHVAFDEGNRPRQSDPISRFARSTLLVSLCLPISQVATTNMLRWLKQALNHQRLTGCSS